jgi:hypothetical protein
MSNTIENIIPQTIREALEQILDYALPAESADYEAEHYNSIPENARTAHIYEAFLAVQNWLRSPAPSLDTTTITQQLEAEGYIVVLWNTDDVLEMRPDLTDEQCKEVLRQCDRKHDAGIGINWDIIRIHADDLFPEPEEIES